MPKFLQEAGFDVMIFPWDHLPPHVHLLGSGGFVKIEIEGLALIEQEGLTLSDIRKAIGIVKAHGGLLAREWKRIVVL